MANATYWKEYTNLQHVKHELIRNYINGWLPKLTQGKYAASRIVYCDTHAGRGKHAAGNLGSPLVALKTVLEHSVFDKIRSEVCFIFIEHDNDNLLQLKKELKEFKPLPRNVSVDCVGGNCFEFLADLTDELEREGVNLAPSFFFCDPFGFSVPGEILQKLMQYRGVEVFANIIWRELDMAIAQARQGHEGLGKVLDSVFAGQEWNTIDSQDFNERAESCVQLLRQVVGADWATYIRMLGKNDQTRYFLLHLTNHDAGREYMKECIWKSCPDGGYYARQKDDPRQQFLITPTPNLEPVEAWVIGELGKKPRRWDYLLEGTREQLWLNKHTNSVIKSLRREGIIEGSKFEGTFAATNNPLLSLQR